MPQGRFVSEQVVAGC